MIRPTTKATVLVVIFLSMLISRRGLTDPEKPTVVIVHSMNDRPAVRIAAELSSLDYNPVKIDMPPPVSLEVLRQIAQDREAVAVIKISPEGNTVRAWTVKKGEDKGASLQEIFVHTSNEQPDAVIAFKTVELLRASLMPLWENSDSISPAEKTQPKVEQPEEVPAAKISAQKTPPEKAQQKEAQVEKTKPDRARPVTQPPEDKDLFLSKKTTPPRLTVSLQPAALFAFDDLPPTFEIGLSLYVRIASRAGIEISGLLPTFPSTFDVPEGGVDILTGLITAGIRFNLLPKKKRFMPAVSVSAGPLFLRARGDADSGYRSRSDFLVAAAVTGALDFSFAVNDIVSLRADASCGVTVPKPVIRIAQRDAATFGRPLLTVLFGVEIRLL